MSAWLDAVALEAAEVLAGKERKHLIMVKETPDNGEWKVILCFIQSINRLQWESQLYSRTMLQDEYR